MADRQLKIQLHDFAGHPFQADLSREFARRGFVVDHVFSAQYSSGKGRLQHEEGDPSTLTFTPISVDAEFDKYSPIARSRYELAYATAWKKHIQETKPDLVFACNVPLLTLNRFRAWATRTKQPWILWHQDIFSRAMGDELDRRFPALLAKPGRAYFTSRERKAVASATRVIAIGEEFRKLYAEWNIDPATIEIIPNWAPVDDIKPAPRENAWSIERLAPDKGLRLLYAGMLGRKHNPQLLIDLLDAASASHQTELVVVSEGQGAEDILEVAGSRADSNITVLPFQSAENLPMVLGSGDVLVAILEPEASKFSIPSKVLSYMSAGRPILGLMPSDNPAADDIVATGGLVASPDADGIGSAVGWIDGLVADPELIELTGKRARRLAEDKFGIEPITDQFVAVVEAALHS